MTNGTYHVVTTEALWKPLKAKLVWYGILVAINVNNYHTDPMVVNLIGARFYMATWIIYCSMRTNMLRHKCVLQLTYFRDWIIIVSALKFHSSFTIYPQVSVFWMMHLYWMGHSPFKVSIPVILTSSTPFNLIHFMCLVPGRRHFSLGRYLCKTNLCRSVISTDVDDGV